MNFGVGTEEAAFAEAVRGALVGYERAAWSPGAALDDRDPLLAARLRTLGVADAADAGHGFVAADGLELGRACAPLALFDELAVDEIAVAASGLARYAGGCSAALDMRQDGAFLVPLENAQMERALDSQGFVRLSGSGERAPAPELETWASFHTAYLAGVAAAALALAVDHARVASSSASPSSHSLQSSSCSPTQRPPPVESSCWPGRGRTTRGLHSLTRAAPQQPWRALYPLLRIAQTVARRRYLRSLR